MTLLESVSNHCMAEMQTSPKIGLNVDPEDFILKLNRLLFSVEVKKTGYYCIVTMIKIVSQSSSSEVERSSEKEERQKESSFGSSVFLSLFP